MALDIYCKGCGRVIMKKAVIVIGEIKCRKCGEINKLNITSQKALGTIVDRRRTIVTIK